MNLSIRALGALLLAAAGAGAQGDFASLKSAFQRGDARAQQRAVKDLAALGTDEAFQFIVDRALTSERSRVADEAQLALGGVREGAGMGALMDALGAKGALVRERAWEAAGRLGEPLPDAAWKRVRKEKDPSVLRTLFWSLQRRGEEAPRDTRLLEKTERSAAKAKDPFERAAALELWPLVGGESVFEGKGARVLASGDAAKHHAPRMALLRARPTPARVAAGLADPYHGARVLAAEMAPTLGREGAALLVDRLEAGEPSIRVRRALIRTLERASGESFGSSVRGWRAWADGLPEGWTPAAGEARARDAKDDDDGDDSTTAFVGHRIHSGRVIFVIDMSGSMWSETGGTTRKARCEAELRKALEGLPEDARFSVLPFATEPAPWKPELKDATPKNVARALKDFEGLTLRGQGDYWRAIGRALECEEADTIIVLGDGNPSGGDRWNRRLMIDLWKERNRHRMVALEALLFDPTKGALRDWAEIAAFGGGACVEVTL